MAAYGTSFLIAMAVSLATTAISMGVQALLAPNIKGPRQKDSGIQGSDYGRPIPLVYGPSNRLSGTVIFYSGLQEASRKKSGSGGSNTTYTYSCSVAVLCGQGVPGAQLARIWANKKLIYENGELTETGKIKQGSPVLVAESVVFYDGDASQVADPTLESYLGVDNVPGYRHSMYFVLKNLQLADFGPTCPYFDFELRAHDEITPAEVVTDMATRAGVDIDVSMLDGNVGNLDGYTIDSDISVSDAMIPLGVAYFFDIAERGGGLVAVPRGMDHVATVPADDMAATDSEPRPAFAIHERVPDCELPREVAITYRDLFRDMQPLTQRASRNTGSPKENLSVDLPLTLDPGQARRIANRVLWGTSITRRSAKTQLSDKWLDLLPGDVVRLETPTGGYLPYRLSKKTRGTNAVSEVEFEPDDPRIYDCATVEGGTANTGISGGDGDPADSEAGDTTFIPMDIPFLRDAHNNAGFYWVVTGTADAWGGAQMFRSTDGGTDYEPMGRLLGAGTTGSVAAAVPAGPSDVWDRATTIRVTMGRSGELESKSELSVLNGSNVAWIGPESGVGGEILQFADAVLVSAGVYDISTLLRGRRGTEWAIGEHETGERFVLLSDSTQLERQDFGAADLDLERDYKGVAMLTSIDDATATQFTNTGEALRCLAPAHLIGRRNASADLAVSWVRRTRAIVSALGAEAPLGEEDETYQVDFFPSAEPWIAGQWAYAGDMIRAVSTVDYAWHWFEATVSHEMTADSKPDGSTAYSSDVWREVSPLRTMLIADQSTYNYSAAQQASDGITPGLSLNIQCRQRSAARGFGHPAVCGAV
jgi:hypothetical protein